MIFRNKASRKKKSRWGFLAFGVFILLFGSIGVGLMFIVGWALWFAYVCSENKNTIENKSQDVSMNPEDFAASAASEEFSSRHSLSDSAKVVNKYAFLPSQKDGCYLAYKYTFPFTLTDASAALKYTASGNWNLTAKRVGEVIYLFAGDSNIGILEKATNMVSDWLDRNDPYLIIAEQIGFDCECYLKLGFYRDLLKVYNHLEQTVVGLTSYSSESKQDSISFVNEGSPVEMKEHDTKDGVVIVLNDCGEIIGHLPKKIAERFLDSEPTFSIIDHFEIQEGDFEDVKKPYVRIFW